MPAGLAGLGSVRSFRVGLHWAVPTVSIACNDCLSSAYSAFKSSWSKNAPNSALQSYLSLVKVKLVEIRYQSRGNDMQLFGYLALAAELAKTRGIHQGSSRGAKVYGNGVQ
eukprot:GHVT01092326.1.p1 GENE.GHVT01092326.1~~GHVT01092326.1.p1  ORF type:complete len:111 (-),score=5.39 GHVT01092326.1:545-877(-)